jgi:hypothetical protein
MARKIDLAIGLLFTWHITLLTYILLPKMNEAGLVIEHQEVRWGEIWAEVRPGVPG